MKITYEEFFDYVWNEYISERVVPNRFLSKNRDLVESVTYNIYHAYEKQGNISESHYAKMIEMFFSDIIKIGVIAIDNDNYINDAFSGY